MLIRHVESVSCMTISKKGTKGWLDVGYKIFGQEGPEGIQVERLARILGVNKSSFYHFFGDKEIFIGDLLHLHMSKAKKFTEAVNALENFDPDFIELLVSEFDTIMVHRQLVKHSEVHLFYKTYRDINAFVDIAILRLWGKELNLPQDAAFRLFDLVRDSFYSRISQKNYSVATIRQILAEVKMFLEQLNH